ncbi:hypothetical protein LFYK43_22390 [Ligilactobacillus salitolerans]|uniref:DUF2200 domain-containing protein n=1 Tax=Ligilactobacillus salitolerans TaxID=1808352 RepID=A0A401IW58_9LACO|nr:DUF2200 domain-containing protein [Ligilactobacillus salitolerans]GBG95780.1 hypothetical protein LFYK43_22390 [Ligilactobacillus salitolerans]
MKNDDRITKLKFAQVYPLYLQKVERKERTKEELDEVLKWLTGYDEAGLQAQLVSDADLAAFFEHTPQINPAASQIKGVICGIRVEEITDPLVQKIRWMDKVVDELAKGKALEKVMRQVD